MSTFQRTFNKAKLRDIGGLEKLQLRNVKYRTDCYEGDDNILERIERNSFIKQILSGTCPNPFEKLRRAPNTTNNRPVKDRFICLVTSELPAA